MKNKFWLIALVPVLLITGIIILAVLPWFFIAIGVFFQPSPPQPEIKHGEFPFQLVYEINGAKKEISDTIICDYDGIGMDEGRGKYPEIKVFL